MAIAPKVEATRTGRRTFLCHLCQFVVVYTVPPHRRGYTHATPNFGIYSVIIQV